MPLNIPIYYLSLFRIPKGVADDLEKIIRGFVWYGVDDGKIDHLVNRAAVQKPKEEGGLGLGNLISKMALVLSS